jgi:hypothetical protein
MDGIDTDQLTRDQLTMIQVILANTSSAMKISKILCDHSEDKILKADEIICGLIYRLMIPMENQEVIDSLDEAKALMYDNDDEYDNEDDIVDDIVDDMIELNKERKVKCNHCNCEICSQVRVCLLNFNDYIPKDELGDKFKCSIIETCGKYNRFI